jgi:hypothetical protein
MSSKYLPDWNDTPEDIYVGCNRDLAWGKVERSEESKNRLRVRHKRRVAEAKQAMAEFGDEISAGNERTRRMLAILKFRRGRKEG